MGLWDILRKLTGTAKSKFNESAAEDPRLQELRNLRDTIFEKAATCPATDIGYYVLLDDLKAWREYPQKLKEKVPLINADGQNLAHIAAARNMRNMIDHVPATDLLAKDNQGYIPLLIAESNGHADMVKLIQRKMSVYLPGMQHLDPDV